MTAITGTRFAVSASVADSNDLRARRHLRD